MFETGQQIRQKYIHFRIRRSEPGKMANHNTVVLHCSVKRCMSSEVQQDVLLLLNQSNGTCCYVVYHFDFFLQ